MRHGETAPVLVVVMLAGSALLSGCATQAPVTEVRLISDSFKTLDASSQPLLDDLAAAEREQGRRAALIRAQPAAGGDGSVSIPDSVANAAGCRGMTVIGGESDKTPKVLTGFCTADSAYYSVLTDPPATAAFRHGLAALGAYTDLLLTLAEGRNLPEAQAQVKALSGNLGTILAAAGAPGASAALGTAVTALQPVLDLAARQSNLEELKRLLLEDSGKVDAVATALRDAAPELFATLTEAPLRQFNEEGLDNPAIAREAAARVEGYRVAVSNYVVLLDRYNSLLQQLSAAMKQPKPAATLAVLVQRSAELSQSADAWRRTLSGLRTGLH